MSSPVTPDSYTSEAMKPERIQHYFDALVRFGTAYNKFWETHDRQHWAETNAAAPEASKALALVGIEPVGFAPAFAGGRAYPGLQNILLLEQQYGQTDFLPGIIVQGLSSLEEWRM